MASNQVCFEMEGGNKELKVEDNKEFEIFLKGNPTTGYSWYMENVEEAKNSNVIESLNLNEYGGSKDYGQDPNKQGMCGAGGNFVFKFKVNNAAGKELPKLVFVYKRIWEKNVPPHSKAEVTLKL